MQKTYWTIFVLGLLGVLFSILLIVSILILTARGLLNKKHCIVAEAVSFFAIIISLHLLIPCVKDYKFVSNGEFLEDDGLVVEFTYIKNDLDGNGYTQHSKPKFYIEDKDKYIILNVANVEVGKTYRIRYLPNTKISEIVSCIE